MNSWLLLGFSIASEVAGTTALKLSEGFTRPLFVVILAVCYGLSFYAFSIALRQIHLGMAYAIWAGLGTASIALIGMIWFGESMTLLKAVSMIAIVAGVVGLNMGSGTAA